MWLTETENDDDVHDDLQAPMLAVSGEAGERRRPLEIISNIFKRRKEQTNGHFDDPDDQQQSTPQMTLHESDNLPESDTMNKLQDHSQMDDVLTLPVSPSITSSVHHTPSKSRDLGEDIEAIRLSRQDNPYLQKVCGSQSTLNDADQVDNDSLSCELEDTAQLVRQASHISEEILSLTEVHEHLIRSPPPTTVDKSFFVLPHDEPDIQDPPTSMSQSLNPLIARGKEGVIDHHLRNILSTQRQLIVSKGCLTSSSVPGSPAIGRGFTKRSPRARTLSEEASSVHAVGGNNMSGGVSVPHNNSSGVSLAPVLPPGRRPHSPNEILLNPSSPSSCSPAPTPQTNILKPINSRNKKSFQMKTERAVSPSKTSSSGSLNLPIKSPNKPAAPVVMANSAKLIDIT